MSRMPADPMPSSMVLETNPDEDCSPAAFRRMLAEVLAGEEPELDSIDAVEALRAIRVDSEQ